MQTLLLRRTAFDAAGGFSPKEELTGLDDTEFFIRLACSGGEIIYVSGVYGSWTSHDGNYSKSRRFQDTRLTLIEHLRTLARTMRRLSIIDLSTGDQPIFNEDRTLAIVFNGEIYNYRELRETLLKKGHVFATASDTETILHLYEEYGENCPKYLDGMCTRLTA